MTEVITIISRYIICALMILYTILAFWVLKYKSAAKMKGCYAGMNAITFLTLTTGFAVIFINKKEINILLLYGAAIATMFLYQLVFRLIYKKANLALLNHMMMFFTIGLIMLARLDFSKAMKQIIFMAGGMAVTLIVPKMFEKLKAARRWAAIMGSVGLVMLMVVLVWGKVTHGANLSISFAGFSFQPSEFVKISFVLLVAVLLRERTDIKRVLLASVIAMVHGIILVASTDLGAAFIYCMAYIIMLYCASKKPVYLLLGFAAMIVASLAAYKIFGHVRIRVQAWRNPWPVFLNKGNQVGNSLFGIATGGWFGLGLFRGQPKYIPEVTKDFIFAAICEEMGGVTGICVILICAACLFMFIVVAADLYLPFYKLTGIGLSAIYGTQVFLTIGGNIKFIPSTGVTLPFVSYGGSSVLSTLIIFCIMQELYIKHQNEVERIEISKEKIKTQK